MRTLVRRKQQSPEEFLDWRSDQLRERKSTCADLGFSMKLADSNYALGAVTDEAGEVDDADYCITIPFAASHGRDNIGDFLEVKGIDCSLHRRNPVAYAEHAWKDGRAPIGKCEDPDRKYTVEILPARGLATAKIYLAKGALLPGTAALEARQVFELYQQRIIRAGSIGYRILEAEILPADPDRGYFKKALHLIRTQLTEVSAVGLPMNGDAVVKALDNSWAGHPLADHVKSMLLPYRPDQKIWSQGVSVKSMLGVVQAELQTHLRGKDTLMEATENPTIETKHEASAGIDAAPSLANAVQTKYMHSEPQNIPHGAYFLANLYDRLETASAMIKHHNLDNPKAVECVKGLEPKLTELCGVLGKGFEAIYPDLEPIHGVQAERAAGNAASVVADEKSANRVLRTKAAALEVTTETPAVEPPVVETKAAQTPAVSVPPVTPAKVESGLTPEEEAMLTKSLLALDAKLLAAEQLLSGALTK